ncbi:unnamed protein product [Rotaria sp. Silwood1]|nr:unnamed protein product [Rotaria sp. Silwood1]CAF1657925.1 unnamed protein product [Rotaria sp. Silwood1]CAF3860531.1 unnamed protein product [Rotaria sp. Silwood1]CAF3861071.1 unnamed protein product [Rotaria sp. Silwood1]CAF3984688.1 unnamed protein product [Rotaria sp. Silwood1]
MTMWAFCAFVWLVFGQVAHSRVSDDERLMLRALLGRDEVIAEPLLNVDEESKSISNIDENNYDRDILNDVERRDFNNDFEKQVFDLTNEARQKGRYCGGRWHGATTPLKWNDQLKNAANKHARSMLAYNYFSHTGIDGSSFVDRTAAAGYPRNCAGGENIAGNQTPRDTVNAWLKSSGHCSNIMNRDFKTIGVGYARGGPYGGYWVQKFGRC